MEPGEGHTTGRVALTSALTSLSHNVGSKHKPKLNTHVLASFRSPSLSLSLSVTELCLGCCVGVASRAKPDAVSLNLFVFTRARRARDP